MHRLFAVAALLVSATPALAETWAEQHYGLPMAEIRCLTDVAVNDSLARFYQDNHVKSDAALVPDPIAKCGIPASRVPQAMDLLMDKYQTPISGQRGAPSWVEGHCEAKPAIPRNKWVCTYNGVTREYR